MTQIVLEADQQTGAEFRPSGKEEMILLAGHVGGTWVLQVKTPDGEWINTDVDFTNDGIKAFMSTPNFAYRMNTDDAANVGARAWATGSNYQSFV